MCAIHFKNVIMYFYCNNINTFNIIKVKVIVPVCVCKYNLCFLVYDKSIVRHLMKQYNLRMYIATLLSTCVNSIFNVFFNINPKKEIC